MEINKLNQKQYTDERLKKLFVQFENLLTELSKKDLPISLIETINKDIDDLNNSDKTEKEVRKAIRKKQTDIITLVEKEVKIVPKNYYRNYWMAVGMAAFGLPIGVLFGIGCDNMGLLSLGLPIGMAIGIGIGAQMDKKASNEGRQLDIEIKE